MTASAFDRTVSRVLIALLWGGVAAAHRACRRVELDLGLRAGSLNPQTLLETVP